MWPSGNTHTRYCVSHILSRKTQGKNKILRTGTFTWAFGIIKPGLYIDASEYATGRAMGSVWNHLFLKSILRSARPGRPKCRAGAFPGPFPSLYGAQCAFRAFMIESDAGSAACGKAGFRLRTFPAPSRKGLPRDQPEVGEWNARPRKFRLDYPTALKYVYSRQSP